MKVFTWRLMTNHSSPTLHQDFTVRTPSIYMWARGTEIKNEVGWVVGWGHMNNSSANKKWQMAWERAERSVKGRRRVSSVQLRGDSVGFSTMDRDGVQWRGAGLQDGSGSPTPTFCTYSCIVNNHMFHLGNLVHHHRGCRSISKCIRLCFFVFVSGFLYILLSSPSWNSVSINTYTCISIIITIIKETGTRSLECIYECCSSNFMSKLVSFTWHY